MDMSLEVIHALKSIARTKDVDEEMILETLRLALISAARKKFGASCRVNVDIDEQAGKLDVYCLKTVVEEVEDPQVEISLEEARKSDPQVELGQEVRVDIPIEAFGRNAIQAAKQIVVQRVREAERERIYQEYEKRIGEIVTGSVQQIDRGNIIVNLGRTEAILPMREQIPREQFRQGNTIKAYIIDVNRSSKGPQVVLSRAHKDFLSKLFELEVPEIKDGTVEIKAVAREPGARSKIAVCSHDEKVDAVGACVGMKGSRVQTIVRELGGERIDIVLWSDDPITFVTRALSPAKVVHAELDPDDRKVTVVVADDQLSLAIGKGGQNARLAAKLTSYKIDLINESQYAERLEFEKLARLSVGEVDGISERIKDKLLEAGFDTVDSVLKAGVAGLVSIEGIGEKTAAKIVEAAQAKLDSLIEEYRAAKARKAEQAKSAEDSEDIETQTGEDDSGEEVEEQTMEGEVPDGQISSDETE